MAKQRTPFFRLFWFPVWRSRGSRRLRGRRPFHKIPTTRPTRTSHHRDDTAEEGSTRKHLVLHSMNLWPPSELKSAACPPFRETRHDCINLATQCIPGLSGDLLIAICEDLENLSTKRQDVPHRRICDFHAQTDLSQTLRSPSTPHAAKCPSGETLGKLKR